MIKGSIQEETITIVNIYALSIEAPKYIKQILTDIKGKIDSNTIILGNINTLLTSMDKSSKEKVNKETLALNDTLDQMDSIDIHKRVKSSGRFNNSSACGTFSRIDHTVGHKTSLGKFKKIEIISSNFSDHNAMRLEIN